MTFDSRRKRVVLFGGVTRNGDFYGTPPDDRGTWEWDGALWTQVEDIGPEPRFVAEMAFDETRGVTVLTGGIGQNLQTLSDTWLWDGSSWTQFADDGPAVSLGALARDATTKRLILLANDGQTWSWDGNEWTQVADTGPRLQPVMDWDSSTTSIVAAGYAGDGGFQTWTWREELWRQLTDIGPRLTGGFVGCAFPTGLVIQGGGNGTLPVASTWGWNGHHWTELEDMGPGARGGQGMAYDSARKRVVLFGGFVGSVPALHNDTWEFWDHDSPT
jgi:hypothetical protein